MRKSAGLCGGNARCAIAHRSAQANKCLATWRQVLNFPWLPRRLRLDIVKSTIWQALLRSSSVWTKVKAQRQNCELECENGGECDWSEQAILDGGGPVVETVAQNRTSMVRKMQHEPGVSWAGHVARMDYAQICAKALRCRGLQWWRWRQLH